MLCFASGQVIFDRLSEGVLYGQKREIPHLMRVNLIIVGSYSENGTTIHIRFFSESVVASLEYFKGKVSQVVKAVCFSFDDFDLVVDPFQFTCVDGVVTMV